MHREARNKVIEKEKDTENVNKVRSGKKKSYEKDPKQKKTWANENLKEPCGRCGYDLHPRGKCPAENEICNHCKKKGHFMSMCFQLNKERTKQIREESEDTDSSETESEEGFVSAIEETIQVNKVRTLMNVVTNGITIQWQPDTGTDRNIMDEEKMICFLENLVHA